MQWFEDQIRTRMLDDDEAFQKSFFSLSSVVTGERYTLTGAESAVEELFQYFGERPVTPPAIMDDWNDKLDYMLRPTGIMQRRVTLKGKWWKESVGPMLGHTVEGEIVALLPKGRAGYGFRDPKTGEEVRINDETAKRLSEEASCFYRPFPAKALGIPDLIRFMISCLDRVDFLWLIVATLLTSLLGLISPRLNQLLFADVIPMGAVSNIAPVAAMFVGVALAGAALRIVKTLANQQLTAKIDVAVSSAAMSRLINLPVRFFRDYNSGELQSRVGRISQLCQQLSGAVLTTGLSTVFSLAYLFQIGTLAPALVTPALLVLFVQLAVTLSSTWLQMKYTRRQMQSGASLNGLVFLLFSGIQKIKLAGAERRAFSKWAERYKEDAELSYNPPLLLKLQPVLSGSVTLLGTLLLYATAAGAGVSVADYMAFNVSYGMLAAAMMALAGMATTFADIKPMMEMVAPILKTVPEMTADKKMVSRISGGVELANVSFRYAESGPMILRNINLKIKPGQYVAIVGKTGCGKSTLMRMLLGFETPLTGAVYYDNRDITALDLRSLRRNIGVVTQNGKLFAGDIFSNIVISAPWLTLDDAWAAARMAGMEEDIRNMPMGMHTLIAEGAGGISGGQRQRLMIARAIAPKPKILMLDEATSALDNITQRIVSDALDGLKCTRIVIAHRLSTIRHADRIIVLDGGSIVEDGSYEALIEKGGFFAELVKRQMVDTPA